jgi:sepiapterin reductase
LLNNALYNVICKELSRTIVIVNITSLLAIKAFASFTQYSVGKAAREAYFRSFALEHDEADCRVLQYSPGPVDTEMHAEVHRTTYDETVREHFQNRPKPPTAKPSDLHRRLITPKETVDKLIGILNDNRFENGSRVDFFD